MRHAFLRTVAAAAWLAACAVACAASAPANAERADPGVESHWITQYFRCGNPMMSSLTTIDADGRASRSDMSGAGPERALLSAWDKRLSSKSVRILERAVAGAGLADLPDDLAAAEPRRTCMDCCEHTLTVESARIRKKVSYDDVHIPPKLMKLLEKIDALLKDAPVVKPDAAR